MTSRGNGELAGVDLLGTLLIWALAIAAVALLALGVAVLWRWAW